MDDDNTPREVGSNAGLGPILDALASLRRQLDERESDDAETSLLLTVERATALLDVMAGAPSAIMDTRAELAVCAEREEDFPALYALQGRRVLLVDLGPNVELTGLRRAEER
jgi:hypothetical protein